MCDFRKAKVSYPDGREVVLFVRVREDGTKYCDPCGLSDGAFRRRTMTPHDTLEHAELYHGATVQRGRRLSEAQIKRAGLLEVFQDPRFQGELIVTRSPAEG